ncbi:hypothetical protein X975_12086, partial [Stegodyphus mimosarum]
MPVKVIGKKSWFVGKYLFEILCNLKNYGVGRVVVKNSYSKYPEISYYVIRKVVPMREIIGIGPDELLYGKVWVDEVYRGRKMEGLRLLTYDTCFTDYHLIPKEDEDKYLKYETKDILKTLPKYDDLPPVLSELIKAKNPDVKEPKLELVYKDLSEHLVYRIAEEGETPDYKLKV